MKKILLEKRLQQLKEFEEYTKADLGITEPILVLYGKKAMEYANENNIKLRGGFFDYENKDEPVILIRGLYGIFIKAIIRHELTHYKQFIENRMVPVKFSDGKKYFQNESEIEAYLEGKKAFSKAEFIQKFLYIYCHYAGKFLAYKSGKVLFGILIIYILVNLPKLYGITLIRW